jgi:hypothetical protein
VSTRFSNAAVSADQRLVIKSAGLALLAILVVPAAASAAEPATAGPCAPRAFTPIFSAYGDSALYTLTPDGDFEAGAAGWTRSAGAVAAADSSTIKLGPKLGAKSLQLAAGASATSPAICVERGFSGFRFVARSATATQGVVNVEVLNTTGKVKGGGSIKTGAAWGVTGSVKLVEGQFKLKDGESTTLQLKFTASGGPVRIDDVYIDPRLRR